jgi:gamma-glutamyltranspeptidase/glutathione hydrolase
MLVVEARRFPTACVASPHYLASATGLAVLASGGNALDAAVAMNLTLGVTTPYLCGFGGDLFALVWRDDTSFAYNGSGAAPAAATLDSVRTAAGGETMPTFGPLTVTVPGAVDGWFALLERFGSRPFEELASWALGYASRGFPLTRKAAERLRRAKEVYRWSVEWQAVYSRAEAGTVLRQSDLARTIEELCESGPDSFYKGPIAHAIAKHVQSLGGLITAEDMADHRGDWVQPLKTAYRGYEVLELPPNTQGVTALEALNIVQAAGSLPPEGPDRHHLLIEATKLALSDRDLHVTDPRHMSVSGETLASMKWAAERARAIDRGSARDPLAGRTAAGGTAYMCAADGEGMCVSLIQSNFMGFGAGVTVPEWGINLQNRGAFFSLEPTHANAIGPRKRTLHTLIPAMVLRGGRPWLVFGSMGGDGQPQIHLQLLVRMVDDHEDPQRAISEPRWILSPGDWSVSAESRFQPDLIDALRARGHRITVTDAFDPFMGHAHAIQMTDQGYAGATDPRAEGAALGL